MGDLPSCHVLGCSERSDPRQCIHGPGGKPVPSCESHGMAGLCSGDPCTCPPHNGIAGPTPVWQAACDRLEELRRLRAMAEEVLLS